MNDVPLFIENISRQNLIEGFHSVPGRCILIQIRDPDTPERLSKPFPDPLPHYNFEMAYRFEFFDAEDHHDDVPEELMISDQQAKDLVNILLDARDNRQNVIVHCHAGLCRSGAVAEVGVILGFKSTGRRRLPNLRVKKKMMDVLGLSYDVEADREIQLRMFKEAW